MKRSNKAVTTLFCSLHALTHKTKRIWVVIMYATTTTDD